MTLTGYLRLLRTRWISVTLTTLLGLAVAGVVAAVREPVYAAHVQLFVAPATVGGDLGQLSQGDAFVQQRVRSYTQLVTSPGVLAPVVRSLGLELTPAELAEHVHATNPLDTVLVDITVDDSSPHRAADVANETARCFTELITRLESAPGRADSPVSLSITRAAVAPTAPTAPRRALYLALGLLAGLGAGVAVAALRDSLDRTLTTRAGLAALTGLPVLGTVVDDPRAPTSRVLPLDDGSARAESYRQLRTNVRFLSVDRRLRSLVVTGSLPGEGKSTTAANLAVALARAGESVVLVDADLRRPSVADLFAVPAGVGLTSVLVGDVAVSEALQTWRPDLALHLLTAGPQPPNPSELLSSARMAGLLDDLVTAGHLVVVDSPPLLPVTDAAVLARATDGALLVVRARSTRGDAVLAACEALDQAGATLLGTILTRVPRQASPYHDAYRAGPDRRTGRRASGTGRRARRARRGQRAPEPRSTAEAVLSRISASRATDQFST